MRFARPLRERGMSEREARAKAALFTRGSAALASFQSPVADAAEPAAFFVPGRIEVLGKHTDYAGGRSLLCAMERGFAVLAAPRADARVRVVDALLGDMKEFVLDPSLDTARGDWSNYVATLIRALMRHFPSMRRGADIAFASDLPIASGMSSSSAMVIAMFLALDAVNDLSRDETYRRVITSPEALAGYLGAVENGRSFGELAGDRGVGTLGGSQDQTAILCCKAGVLSRYSFCPVRREGEVELPHDRTFVVAYSGVAASKTSNALRQYNEASLAVSEILKAWNAATNSADMCLADAVVSAPDSVERLRSVLAATRSAGFTAQRLRDRLDQFVDESYEIIPHAASALARCDLDAFGELVDRSQRGVEQLLGNQVPETVALARLARERGADAASAFGAGFGGSVWALVPVERADQFLDEWRASYRESFPAAGEHAEFFTTAPGPGAMRVLSS